jgi:hypothetical protein
MPVSAFIFAPLSVQFDFSTFQLLSACTSSSSTLMTKKGLVWMLGVTPSNSNLFILGL